MARVEEQDERHSSGMVACVRDCHCDCGELRGVCRELNSLAGGA